MNVNTSAQAPARHGASTFDFVQVALPTPLFTHFDYRWNGDGDPVPGVRVRVPFGNRRMVGIVLGGATRSAVPAAKLKSVQAVLDNEPVLPPKLLERLRWAARYYHHPLGEVLSAALPVPLRLGEVAVARRLERWSLSASADGSLLASPSRAPVQHALWQALATAGSAGLDAAALRDVGGPRWRKLIERWCEQGQVRCEHHAALPMNRGAAAAPRLNDQQQQALAAIRSAFGRFETFLLQGVTGSGKTEVYLRAMSEVLAAGQQVLVLVPEIGLTPQLMQRFAARLDARLSTLHSGLNDSERVQAWLHGANGEADVLVGTRSAVLCPLPRLGLIIIDEEHDGSLKQQDGFRYHARDIAIMRARDEGCPIVMGSATPSFESLLNASRGRYQRLRLSQRAGGAQAPTIELLDIRRRKLIEGLGEAMLIEIRKHLEARGQVLVFLNRRGYATTLLCNDCGEAAGCRRCDANMTVHARKQQLRCHHCGAERPLPLQCESCGSQSLDHRGYGTERIADALGMEFPEARISLIDRDSTRRKGALQARLAEATAGEADILVGTQMLAKGHHFPNVTLVSILDADRGLHGTDFRSPEHMAQLVVQVAGRAGRAERPGKVLIQTRNPDNPLLRCLVSAGYEAFADIAMEEREAVALPPYSHLVLLRAEAVAPTAPAAFLDAVIECIKARFAAAELGTELPEMLGPAPAPIERVGGRYRAQLLLQASERAVLQRCLDVVLPWLPRLPEVKKVRWSVDVDPVDLF